MPGDGRADDVTVEPPGATADAAAGTAIGAAANATTDTATKENLITTPTPAPKRLSPLTLQHAPPPQRPHQVPQTGDTPLTRRDQPIGHPRRVPISWWASC